MSTNTVRRDRDKLRAFALELFGGWADGQPLTDQTLERLALEHGLLAEERRTHPCGDGCTCWEAGRFPHVCLRFTALLTGDRNDPVASAQSEEESRAA